MRMKDRHAGKDTGERHFKVDYDNLHNPSYQHNIITYTIWQKGHSVVQAAD